MTWMDNSNLNVRSLEIESRKQDYWKKLFLLCVTFLHLFLVEDGGGGFEIEEQQLPVRGRVPVERDLERHESPPEEGPRRHLGVG